MKMSEAANKIGKMMGMKSGKTAKPMPMKESKPMPMRGQRTAKNKAKK